MTVKKDEKVVAEKVTEKKVKTKATEDKAVVSKLRIKVVAYEYKILDSSVKQIMDTAFRLDANVRGPVPLPTSIKKYTVNRSTFIFKDAREQFEMRVHKRLIDILSPSKEIIDALTNLNLPAGVDIDVKLM
jgi:small subunit ribosomal protein S10